VKTSAPEPPQAPSRAATPHDAFLALAQPFLERGVLEPSDVYAVALAAPRFGETDPERMLGLAFAARAPRLGHAGVDLSRVAQQVDDELRLHAASRQASAVLGDLARGLGSPPAASAGPTSFGPTSLEPAGFDDAPEDDAELTPHDDALAADSNDRGPLALPLQWPAPDAWAASTFASPLVGSPAERALPFVRQPLSGSDLLLTRRMFVEQERVATALRARAASPVPEAERLQRLDAILATLFPTEPDGENARAVRLAAEHRLALVVGGPGTGKTFSLSRLLAAMLLERGVEEPLSVALAAPTGKAAARMREALREAASPDAKAPLAVDDAVRARLCELESHTLHRLVGVRPDGSSRHGPSSPIPARTVVVDEVSMVDLAMMRRLLEAVHPEARLILLGDRDQLASVEAGSVLADLVHPRSAGPLSAHTQLFTTSHRFASAPDVGLVAACLQSYATRHPEVPAGQDERPRLELAISILEGSASSRDERHPGARIRRLPDPIEPSTGRPRPSDTQLAALAAPYLEGFELLTDGGTARVEGYAQRLAGLRVHAPRGAASHPRGATFRADARDPQVQRELLEAFERYRVLAVHRRGPFGVAGLERALAQRVRAFLHGEAARSGRHWIGRPILVTENSYGVGLMNGDVGIVLPTAEGPAAVFPDEAPGSVRSVALSRLPAHEGALAMTVHKSQGSQFERVALVLAGRPSPIETRELVYTGVTRAKNQLAWLGSVAELREALSRRVERASGLAALLEGAGASSRQLTALASNEQS
jgi:exodeoxyribonuclease V alpha subunit